MVCLKKDGEQASERERAAIVDDNATFLLSLSLYLLTCPQELLVVAEASDGDLDRDLMRKREEKESWKSWLILFQDEWTETSKTNSIFYSLLPPRRALG